MASNTFEIEQSAQALYLNVLERARTGYAVDSGCAVSVNSGTLGNTDTLSVASGEIKFNGTTVSVSSQTVQIDASDSNPRKDVVYLNANGTAQVAKGKPESTPDGQNASRFQFFTPMPPSLADTASVVLAEVWVPAGSSSLSSADVADRRAYPNDAQGAYSSQTTQTAAYTASDGEYVFADASGGVFTVTLPTPAEGARVGVEKTDSSSNTVTVAPNGTESVNYQSSEDLTAQGESIDLRADGADWFVL